MITAAGAIETVIEDPLFSILKENPYKTQSAGEIRSPGLDDDSATPGPVVFMKDFVTHTEVSVFSFSCFPGGWNLRSSLRQVSHFE